ncbi:MAG: hypothetical protein V4608_17465 [Bacteroidota bacterium]
MDEGEVRKYYKKIIIDNLSIQELIEQHEKYFSEALDMYNSIKKDDLKNE